MTFKVAKVTTPRSTLSEIQAYMPSNYTAFVHENQTYGDSEIIIVGADSAGWTMQGYVLPRLGSGLHNAVELEDWDLAKAQEDLYF